MKKEARSLFFCLDIDSCVSYTDSEADTIILNALHRTADTISSGNAPPMRGDKNVSLQKEVLVTMKITHCMAGVMLLVLCLGCASPTPLQRASMNGNLTAVRTLLQSGADVGERAMWGDHMGSKEGTALHAAAHYGQTDVMRYLIEKGADVNAKGAYGVTPLWEAIWMGQMGAIRLLLDNGADPELADYEGHAPLDWAHRTANKRAEDQIVALLEAAIDKKYGVKKQPPAPPPAYAPPVYTAPAPPPARPAAIADTSVDFGTYHALVIGNNHYRNLPDLRTAVHDAQTIGQLLQDRYGYKVRILTDASRAEILTAINAYRRTLTEGDNLLIYYAGHGWLDRDADQGYWLPVNATRDNQIEWISNNAVTSEIRAIQAKHIIVVADSCYSGKLARGLQITQRTPGYFRRMAQKKARVVISSGGLEPVVDSGGQRNHSIFAGAFIEALSGNRKVMDGTSLFAQIREQVGWNADQTPEYAPIHKAGHGGGDFLFVRKK